MDNKDMLKVEVNLAGRVCVISDSNGTVLLRKPITEAMYSKVGIVESLGKIKEIMVYAPKDKLPNADMTVYEALKELDDANKTNYGKAYLRTVIDRIEYRAPEKDEPVLEKILRKFTGRRLESEASYLKRASESKAEKLSEIGLSIVYSDVSEIENSSELSSKEKSVAIKVVNRQTSHNGVRTVSLAKLEELSGDVVPEVSEEELQRNREEAEKAEEARKAEEAKRAADEARKATEVTVPVAPAQEPKVEPKPEPVAPKDDKPKDEPKREQKAPKAKNKKRKIEGIKAGREEYRQRLQAGNPKKADRPEGAPAPKRETKAERKARLAREAAEQRKASAGKKPVSKADKPNEAPAQSSKTKPTPKTKVEPSKLRNIKQVKVQIEDLKVRFTRKLKDASDSIRNKVYKPHKKGLRIAGVVTLASLLLFAGIKTYSHFNDMEVRGQIADTTSLVQMLEGEKELEEIDKIVKSSTELSAKADEVSPKGEASMVATQTEATGVLQDKQIQDQTGVKAPEATKPEEQGQVEAEEPSSNYLSSYTGETKINLESDIYYEAPNGTGSSGNFGNYTDCKKEMNIVGLQTKEGYRVIGNSLIVKDENGKETRYIQIKTEGREGDVVIEADKVDLAEFIVRQNYPDAQYMAIHFEAEHENKDRTTLGWVRVDFAEKDMDNTRNQVEHEELER